MVSRIRMFVLALVWAGAAFGVLALERLPGEHAAAFCGPWGCLPPLQALAAMHGFWFLLVLPPTLLLIMRASTTWLNVSGALALWGGVMGLIGVAGHGLLIWRETVSDFWRYAGQRLLYSIVIATELPFGQLALAGALLLAASRLRMRRGVAVATAPVEPVPLLVESTADSRQI